MRLLDFTGKLNTHEEYINILEKLEKKSKYIEIFIIGTHNNQIVEDFNDDIIERDRVSKIGGNKIYYGEYNLFRIKASNELFEYLRYFETFCKSFDGNKTYDKDKIVDVEGVSIQYTDFGIDDIAFYDDNGIPLLFTVTHECIIEVREDLLNEN